MANPPVARIAGRKRPPTYGCLTCGHSQYWHSTNPRSGCGAYQNPDGTWGAGWDIVIDHPELDCINFKCTCTRFANPRTSTPKGN